MQDLKKRCHEMVKMIITSSLPAGARYVLLGSLRVAQQ